MDIYLTRHESTQWNINGIVQSWTDIPQTQILSASRPSARKKARVLEGRNITKVYTSGLGRSDESGKEIADFLDIPARNRIVEPAFRDINLGFFDGYTIAEIRDLAPEIYANWTASRLRGDASYVIPHRPDLLHPLLRTSHYVLPQPTCQAQDVARAISALEEITSYEENAVIVTHRDILARLLMAAAEKSSSPLAPKLFGKLIDQLPNSALYRYSAGINPGIARYDWDTDTWDQGFPAFPGIENHIK